ncbi:MAG: cytochrome c biogenesis protein ResB, partial [Planctomycetota bacterium]
MGAGFMALGALVTYIVILGGDNSVGLQGGHDLNYRAIWAMTLASLTATSAGLAYGGFSLKNTTIRSLGVAASVIVGGYVAYCLLTGYAIGEPGLRIVWQLAKGLGAGAVLAIGCVLLFGKQGGNVLLHLGVGLLMVGQFVYGDRQLEQYLSLKEDEATNVFINRDRVELAVISKNDGEQEVVSIPGSRLQAVAGVEGQRITNQSLPFDVRVLQYYRNSELQEANDSKDNPVTDGFGLTRAAVQVAPAGGTDGQINVASAYIEIFKSGTDESLGTHLVTQRASDLAMLFPQQNFENVYDKVSVGDATYDVGLRFQREVKPYWVQLQDVQRINYSGSDTPRDYSSVLRIIEDETGSEFTERVWMNNPMRYRGETFYQSNYTPLPGGKEMTGIQVVQNSGWLIPYVACSMTALGMLMHFSGTLVRFVRKRNREGLGEEDIADPFDEAIAEEERKVIQKKEKRARLGYLAIVASFGLIAVYGLVPWDSVKHRLRPSQRGANFDYYAAGQIPTQFGGRLMPLDAYARIALQTVSNRTKLPLYEEYKESTGIGAAPEEIIERAGGKSKLTALQWLMEVA